MAQRSRRPRSSTPARTTPRDGWSERRNWIYGFISAALAGLIVVVIQGWFGLGGSAPAPAASSSPSPTTSAERTASLSGEAMAADSSASREPVITASVSYPKDMCSTFVVPGSLDDYGPAPEAQDLAHWVRERDGATANRFAAGRGTSMVLITLTGYDERPVTVTDISFSTSVQDPEPLVGTTVANECGDQTVARYAEVDLDQSPPQITASSAVEAPWGEMSTTPLVFPYEVTSSENENLLLIASTTGHVDWEASITWSNGVESGVLKVDDGGKPFRTAQAAEGNPSAIPYGGGEWLQ